MTTSIGIRFGRRLRRVSSRSLRLSRLRSVVVRPRFGTTIPTRGCAKGEAIARTSRSFVRVRFPFRNTAVRSAFPVRRWDGGNRNPSGAGVLRRQLNGEALAPLLATTAQCFPSPSRRHTRPKPVGFDAALITGTVGRLTHEISNLQVTTSREP